MSGPLTVAFLAPSLSREAGGIFEIERCLARQLVADPDVQVEVYGARDPGYALDEASWTPLRPHAFPYRGPSQFRWSPQLARSFAASRADVGHLHAIWMHTSLIMRSWSRNRSKPYLTTINGMLDTWAIKNSGWKKTFCAGLYERDCLNRAGCLQANTQSELEAARAYGLKNPVCIIPNGIEIPELCANSDGVQKSRIGEKKNLLYLGRIHPKKGLANLLLAWRLLRQRSFGPLGDWTLTIAGWDQNGHQAMLEALAAELGIAASVRFVGPLFNDDKSKAYRSADAVVLPSLSEGLPMAVLEAWSYGKPVLMTPQCNLPEGFAADAAIAAQPESESLATALAQLLEATDEQRAAMGERGLALVKECFTWTRVAADMRDVYQWLVGGGPPPASVARS